MDSAGDQHLHIGKKDHCIFARLFVLQITLTISTNRILTLFDRLLSLPSMY